MKTTRATHALVKSLTYSMVEVMLDDRDPRGHAGRTRVRFAGACPFRKRSIRALERRGLVEPVLNQPTLFPHACRTTDDGEELLPAIRKYAPEARVADEKNRARKARRRKRRQEAEEARDG